MQVSLYDLVMLVIQILMLLIAIIGLHFTIKRWFDDHHNSSGG